MQYCGLRRNESAQSVSTAALPVDNAQARLVVFSMREPQMLENAGVDSSSLRDYPIRWHTLGENQTDLNSSQSTFNQSE